MPIFIHGLKFLDLILVISVRQAFGLERVPDNPHGRRDHHRDHQLPAQRQRQVQVRGQQQAGLRQHRLRRHCGG